MEQDQTNENQPEMIIDEIPDDPELLDNLNQNQPMHDPTENYKGPGIISELPVNSGDQSDQPVRKQRIPKHILEGQRKHQEMIEKQQKAMKAKPSAKKTSMPIPSQSDNKTSAPAGMKRVFVGGSFKYIPVASSQQSQPLSKPSDRLNTVTNQPVAQGTTQNTTQDSTENKNDDKVEQTENKRKMPTMLSKKLEQYQAKIEKERNNMNTTKKAGNNNGAKQRRVPARFAKQMEDEVKKRTMQSVKTFSDLRRIKAMEDLDTSNIDTTRTTIIEMRKLKAEQRRREQSESQKRIENNKFESAVQKIKNDDKLSQFAKTLKIKNLSVNSRHKKAVEKLESNI